MKTVTQKLWSHLNRSGKTSTGTKNINFETSMGTLGSYEDIGAFSMSWLSGDFCGPWKDLYSCLYSLSFVHACERFIFQACHFQESVLTL